MGIRFAAALTDIAVTDSEHDLFEIVAPSDKQVLIDEIVISQYTDEGDAQAEMLPVELIRGYTSAGSGGSSVTPRALNSRRGAAGSTVVRNNTTPASGGTAHVLISDAFNVQAGYIWRGPTPRPWETFEQYLDRCIVIAAGERLVLHKSEAPADSVTFNATLYFEELD